MNDIDTSADRTPELRIEPEQRERTAQTGPAPTDHREDHDIELDLDRIVWDPEYRCEVIERLVPEASNPGSADKPG